MARAILFAVLFVLALQLVDAAKADKRLADKVDLKLLKYYDTHATEEEVSFFAVLKQQADITTAVRGKTGKESGAIVFNELTKVASSSQQDLLALLQLLNVQYKSFWIVNMIQISANQSTMNLIAKHESVNELQPNFNFKVEVPQAEAVSEPEAPNAIEWNINWVKAPTVWAKGIDGKGMVVANADTGVQWNHPALITHYRGYGGSTSNVTHDYHWWDSVHTTGSSCGANTKAPCDDNGHGTHTTGTAVGAEGTTNEIGVAPGAKWIACRNMNAGVGSPATYIECMQFFLAPTDLTGKNPNPALRPHVIGNSWGCPTSEGCSAGMLLQAVTNLVNAGIFMSVSAGNSGSACKTITDPPAFYPNVFTVAASGYQTSTIASYSSRGPAVFEGVDRAKPDITAPGSTVRSAYPTNRYVSLSGTSMASPHITGMVALLWQARPELERDIATTTRILQSSAISRAATTCVSAAPALSIQGTTRNNVYGYGELDAVAAINTF